MVLDLDGIHVHHSSLVILLVDVGSPLNRQDLEFHTRLNRRFRVFIVSLAIGGFPGIVVP